MIQHLKTIDLTHPLSSQAPTWTGSCGFCLEVKRDYDRMFRVQQIKMHAGVGTHMDAPSHRFQGKSSIAEIPLEQLIVPLSVIDVTKKAVADYELSSKDIEEYEKSYGRIPHNALVIAYTGWSRFWSCPERYRNLDDQGKMHFPAFSKEAIEILLQREIAGIGIDTLSPDCQDHSFPVHELILGANKYIIENIADCKGVLPVGGYAIAFPLRMEEAAESPIRLVAFELDISF